jgi:hypothetical protein
LRLCDHKKPEAKAIKGLTKNKLAGAAKTGTDVLVSQGLKLSLIVQKVCRHTILPELNLIIEYFAGHIDAECVVAEKNRMINDPLFDQSYNVLDDFRNAIMDYSYEGTKEIIEWIAKNHNHPRKAAHLTTSPDQVVATTLFDNLKSTKLIINLKIFSTLEQAINWVDLDAKVKPIIEVAIENLKSE